MKTRKGFRSITVDTVTYLYAVSLRTHKVIVYQGDHRFEWSLPECDGTPDTWRGKHGDGAFGKHEVAEIIHTHTNITRRNYGYHDDYL